MVMDLTKGRTAARRAGFRSGFAEVLRRAFSLDFSGGSSELPALDERPGWERDAEKLRGDWERVGGYLWGAIRQAEREHPEVAEGRS